MDHDSSALEPAPTTGTPFDALRRKRPDGSEFWSARDMQDPLGYDRWENFAEAINRAKIACRNAGASVSSQFRDATKTVDQGILARQLVDYELTRYAAYLVAMNGDPRKTEISAAQTYFATKTREAELATPARELSRKEILLLALEAEERAEQAERALTVVSNTLAAAEAVIEVHQDDVLFAQDYLTTEGLKAVAQFGRDLRIGPVRIFRRLREIGAWQDVADRPYARHVEAGYFRHDPVSGEVMINPKGEKWLHARLASRDEHRDRL